MIASLSSLPDFDPRAVPLVGVDDHLPTVPAGAQTADALRRRFAAPPQWTPEIVREKKFMQRAPAQAAVLVPIVQRDRPTVLLTERTANLSTHKGQVAFPGGRSDPEDVDAAATALRETHEEVGLESGSVEVLGQLPIYETGSAFIVTPVVALVRPDFVLAPNPHEVADVFEVPLDFLMNPANHHQQSYDMPDGTKRWFYAMPWGDRYIWGATAGMLRALWDRLYGED